MRFGKAIAAAALLLCILIPGTALGNSAPVYESEEPGSHVLPLEENDIRVEKEILTFAMRKDRGADVTAAYTLKNQAGQKRTVEMAFPFLFHLAEAKEFRSVRIAADGEPLPYTFRIAGKVESAENGAWADYLKDPEPFRETVKLENILAGLNKEKYQPEYFERNQKLETYALEYPESNESVNIVASMDLDEEDRILIWGFNGFDISDDNGRAEISAWIGHGDQEEYGFAVLAGDGPENIEVKVYSDGYKKGLVATDEYTLQKGDSETAEALVREHMQYDIAGEELAAPELEQAEAAIKESLAEYALSELDRQLSWGQAIAPASELIGGAYSDCMVGVLLYEIELPAEGTVEMTVEYRQYPTWDASSGQGKTYTYAYLLSPAVNFESFGHFSVRVLPAGDQRHIVSAGIPFAAQEDGSYLAEQEGLPEGELVFTVYQEAAAPAASSIEGKETSNDLFPWISIGIIAASAVLLATVIAVIFKTRKNRMAGE